MTTELVLLMGIFAFVVGGVLIKAPKQAFRDSGPKLGARIERHLATGRNFHDRGGNAIKWEKE